MINTIQISRFKSIKEMLLRCKRFNVFIGEPNTGKSNILEAIGMPSFAYYSRYGYKLRDFARIERTANLFYDEDLEYPLNLRYDDTMSFTMKWSNGSFGGEFNHKEGQAAIVSGDYNDLGAPQYVAPDSLAPFKFYRFVTRESFSRPESDFLMPPSGENLLSLLMANKELRSIVNQPFASMGLRLNLRPQEGKIEIIKLLEDVTISYPYSLTSETLQRLTFYVCAVLSNKSSVLVFEEPEAHAFPYYTKYLAELIALDQQDNQYFISTHNPYFLLPLLDKAPEDEVAVYITYFQDYETKVKELSARDIQEFGEIGDIFSNLDRYLEG